MSDATADAAGDAETPKKTSSKLPLILGIVLALAGGGGGFFAAWSGMLPFGGSAHADEGDAGHAAPGDHGSTGDHAAPDDPGVAVPMGDVAFVEVPQLVVSLGTTTDMHHLRFRTSLEVAASAAADVETLMPRVVDVLNTYLRALEPSDIDAPGALIRLRAQMLRRVQLVTGREAVQDLLVQEFVLN
ncbi:flagellar basal body-associated FliL family protein [Salipiger mucosus]|nr:flagellar basal body-associated FliL family protein [Salipiger mucosus]